MLKILGYGTVVLLTSALLTWCVANESVRKKQAARVAATHRQLNEDLICVKLVQRAQEQADPLIELATTLAAENAMFDRILDRARKTVAVKTAELDQTTEALNESIELLKDQIVENNACRDRIDELDRQLYRYSTLLRTETAERSRLSDENAEYRKRIEELEALLDTLEEVTQ